MPLKKNSYEKFYKKVPQYQIDELKNFRVNHPQKEIIIDGVKWKYISSGNGNQALLLLPGGTGSGEAFFQYIMAFESDFRVISPSFPAINTIKQLIDGIMHILEVEGIEKINIFGQSFGGVLAQVILHLYPDKVQKIILSHTTTTSPPIDRDIKLKKLKEKRRSSMILPMIPISLIRIISKKKILKHLSVMDTNIREFWKAYFTEIIFYLKKSYLLALMKCFNDFGQNYKFYSEDLKNWTGKILIIGSDSDLAISLSEREAMNKLYPQANTYTFQGTGHLSIIIERDKFTSLMKDFLFSS